MLFSLKLGCCGAGGTNLWSGGSGIHKQLLQHWVVVTHSHLRKVIPNASPLLLGLILHLVLGSDLYNCFVYGIEISLTKRTLTSSKGCRLIFSCARFQLKTTVLLSITGIHFTWHLIQKLRKCCHYFCLSLGSTFFSITELNKQMNNLGFTDL